MCSGRVLCICLAAGGLSSCNARPGPVPIADATVVAASPDRLMLVSPGVYSGAEPGADSFASLAEKGVRTVISVDAVPPDAELARTHGIRVVHLPIGYDRVPDWVAVQIAKAIGELDGSVYVHCHHGRHRGPAALAAACVVGGLMTTEEAAGFMRRAGTSDVYTGLWESVASAEPMDAEALFLIEPDLPERAETGGMAATMAEIDRAWDRVKIAQSNGWVTPPEHPDLAPASDLGLIHDLLRSLREDPSTAALGAGHAGMLEESIGIARRAERSLETGDAAAADRAFAALAQSCTDCHRAHRD